MIFRFRLVLLPAGLVVACSAAPPAPATEAFPEAGTQEPMPEIAAPAPGPEAVATLSLADACTGVFQQGGLILCSAAPGDSIRFGEVMLTADDTGAVQFGLPRNAPPSLSAETGDDRHTFPIAPRKDETRVVPGLDCDKVDARTPAQKDHAAESWVKKSGAFATFSAGRGALDGFVPPSALPASSPFGPKRRYTGVSKTSGKPCDSTSVHLGLDFAAPMGSPVTAPAAGTVTLADPDLYYEGGTVFIDHGQGLLSVFMHLSDVEVAAGDEVEAGQLIAKSGNSGRSSGPHLHWGVKWRNAASTDRDGDVYLDPALLLSLPAASPE